MKSFRMGGLFGVRRWRNRSMMLLTAALAGGSLTTVLAAGPAAAQPPGPAPGVTLGVATPSTASVMLAYTGTDGAVYLRNVAQPAGSTYALGGKLIGGPTVVEVPGRVVNPSTAIAVFGRGTDNKLWWRYSTAPGSGVWTPWESLGGALTSKPAAAAGLIRGNADRFGPVSVFVRGTDGGLWYKTLETTGWTSWLSLGGKLRSGTGPGTGFGAGNAIVAIVGTDNHSWVFGRTGVGYGFVDFGGQTMADAATTFVTSGTIAVFARGTDNALWYRLSSSLPVVPTGSWKSLGGKLTTGIAADAVPTIPYIVTNVFALGTDNQPWMRTGQWPNLLPWAKA